MSAAEKVAIIGSGNWGSAAAKIAGKNVSKHSDTFDSEIRMWVYEEMVEGKKLTEIINGTHENVKYLPGVKLPENVVAYPELLDAVDGATLLVFVIPHQFVRGVCQKLNGKVDSKKVRAISLIKGVEYNDKGPILMSDVIKDNLGVDVSVLCGANIANEVAQEDFCETTIGFRNEDNGKVFFKLFNTPKFRVSLVEDVIGVELCGALKNIVAVGAGFLEGLQLGNNTRAALIRIGWVEMRKFCKRYYEGVKDQTFNESCGIADLITTCYGGRNRQVAAAFVAGGKSWEQLEKEMLNGQKLQGPDSLQEVYKQLEKNDMLGEFPLFRVLHEVAFQGLDPKELTNKLGEYMALLDEKQGIEHKGKGDE